MAADKPASCSKLKMSYMSVKKRPKARDGLLILTDSSNKAMVVFTIEI